MSPDEIKHFLVVYDPATGEVDVRSFDTGYEAAQRAYADAEREHGIVPLACGSIILRRVVRSCSRIARRSSGGASSACRSTLRR